MRRSISILCFAAILLTGCNFPWEESALATETAAPISEIGTEPEQDLITSETSTPEPPPPPSSTEEAQPSSTATEQPELPTPTFQTFPTAQPLSSGVLVTITQIQMFDTAAGWGVGYQDDSGAHILYTEDGGYTWDDRSPPDPTAEQPAEHESAWTHFLDSNTAWVIYAAKMVHPSQQEKVIWRTSDAGLSWLPSPPLQADGMEDVFIPEAFTSVGVGHGWLLVHVGGGMSHDYSYLYATQDGGITWERIADPFGTGIQSLENTGIAFADADYGWVTKNNQGILPGAFFEETMDGGSTWEKVTLPAPPELDWFNASSLCETSSPIFTTDQIGMMIVKCRLAGDLLREIEWSFTYIYTTKNRGATWHHTMLPSPVDSLIFLDIDNGWAIGRDHYKTSDGSETWEFMKTVFWEGEISYVDSVNGWGVARNEGEIALVVTENGGQTWQIVKAMVR